jgi:hypothetical protein
VPLLPLELILNDQDGVCPWLWTKPAFFGVQTPDSATFCIENWIDVCDSGHKHCQPESSIPQLPTLSTYRVPTWSWASIHGWVDWWPDVLEKEHETATILSTYTTPVSRDPPGEILVGSITRRGGFNPGKAVYKGSHKYYRPANLVEPQLPPDATKRIQQMGWNVVSRCDNKSGDRPPSLVDVGS